MVDIYYLIKTSFLYKTLSEGRAGGRYVAPLAPEQLEPTSTAATETVIIGDPGLPTGPLSSAETPPKRNNAMHAVFSCLR